MPSVVIDILVRVSLVVDFAVTVLHYWWLVLAVVIAIVVLLQ